MSDFPSGIIILNLATEEARMEFASLQRSEDHYLVVWHWNGFKSEAFTNESEALQRYQSLHRNYAKCMTKNGGVIRLFGEPYWESQVSQEALRLCAEEKLKERKDNFPTFTLIASRTIQIKRS